MATTYYLAIGIDPDTQTDPQSDGAHLDGVEAASGPDASIVGLNVAGLRTFSFSVPLPMVAPSAIASAPGASDTAGSPLRILIVVAQPIGQAKLSVDEEIAVIRRGFEPLIAAGMAVVARGVIDQNRRGSDHRFQRRECALDLPDLPLGQIFDAIGADAKFHDVDSHLNSRPDRPRAGGPRARAGRARCGGRTSWVGAVITAVLAILAKVGIAALGATAGALRRTLLAESLVLCGAGAILGVAIAQPMVAVAGPVAVMLPASALPSTHVNSV